MQTDESVATLAEAHEASAIPRMHEVRVNPDDGDVVPAELPETMRAPAEAKSPARWAYERLILYIQNFEKQLDDKHEVAMGFAGDDTGTIRIEGMGYFDPDIITFYGSDNFGTKTQLVQHVSQLSVMLRAFPKQTEEDAPFRIGFRLAKELEDAKV